MDPQQADFLLGKSIQLIRLSNELSGTFSMEKNAEMKKLQLKRKMLNGE